MLTPEQVDYFKHMEEMFSTPGWRLYMDDIRGNLEALNSAVWGLDEKSFIYAKGRHEVFVTTLGLENFCEVAKKSIEEADNDATL